MLKEIGGVGELTIPVFKNGKWINYYCKVNATLNTRL